MEEIENPQSLIKTHYEQMLFEEKEWSYYWLDHNSHFEKNPKVSVRGAQLGDL